MILALVLGLVVAMGWILYVAAAHGYATALRWKRTMGLRQSHGFFVQPRLFYHPGHTWIAPEADDTVRVGLDDFGRRLVDGIRGVALPATGSTIREGVAAVGIDCGKKRAAVLSPVDGVVLSVNKALSRGGSALERDPYGRGWLFTARVSNPGFSRLPTGKRALEWLERESGRLAMFLNEGVGATAADGGELIARPSRVLDTAQWEDLVHVFLGTSSESLDSEPRGKGAES